MRMSAYQKYFLKMILNPNPFWDQITKAVLLCCFYESQKNPTACTMIIISLFYRIKDYFNFRRIWAP